MGVCVCERERERERERPEWVCTKISSGLLAASLFGRLN